MNSNGTRLSGITKDLWNQWQIAKEDWRDSRSVDFEKKYLEDLLVSVDKAVAVIEQLDKIMTKIRTDCE